MSVYLTTPETPRKTRKNAVVCTRSPNFTAEYNSNMTKPHSPSASYSPRGLVPRNVCSSPPARSSDIASGRFANGNNSSTMTSAGGSTSPEYHEQMIDQIGKDLRYLDREIADTEANTRRHPSHQTRNDATLVNLTYHRQKLLESRQRWQSDASAPTARQRLLKQQTAWDFTNDAIYSSRRSRPWSPVSGPCHAGSSSISVRRCSALLHV